jgi:death on curing protein
VNEPVWLSKIALLLIHRQQMDLFGGPAGVRDEGLLNSALARPVNLLAYGAPTLVEMAAAYAFGIVKNHPFLDGNKRTGFLAAAIFLERNGIRIRADQGQVVASVLALAAGTIDEKGFAAWLADHTEAG